MASLNIAVLGADAAARATAAHEFGKKGSADDIAFYHTVYQGKILSAVEPCAYPKKLDAMLDAVALSDYVLVLADAPSPALGEMIVLLDLAGKKTFFVADMDLAPFISKTSLKDSKVFASLQEAKEHLLALVSPIVPGSPLILIDHCFDVKGVGTVALGLMKRGEVKLHDKLMAYPMGKEIEVRTIQRNDEDVKSSECADRVGLSLKGAESSEVGRGEVFSGEKIEVSQDIKCKISVSKFARDTIKSSFSLHIACGLQLVPARVECAGEIAPGTEGDAALKCEKPLAIIPNEPLILVDLNAKGLRVIGMARVQ
jgi:selenocysteine-specific translation elongation factor